MKNTTIVKKRTLKLVCPLCKSKTHDWKDAYYDSGTVLKKTEKQYIAHCQSTNQFVLSNEQLA